MTMLPLKVLLTGPSGRVGPHLLADFENRYQLSTLDLLPSSRPNSFVGDLNDVASLRRALKGVEVVVHLAATSDEAPFIEQLLPNNIVGLYHLLEAAHQEGVRRVVFASSVQAVEDSFADATAPVETEINAPSSLYGVSKVLGETLGGWFHRHRDLEFVAIRLGWFQPIENLEPDARINNIWISPGDSVRLFRRAIETPDVGYAVVNGTSKAPREILSLRSAREILGYQPRDCPPVSAPLQTANGRR